MARNQEALIIILEKLATFRGESLGQRGRLHLSRL
jgi:hypothetical protein